MNKRTEQKVAKNPDKNCPKNLFFSELFIKTSKVIRKRTIQSKHTVEKETNNCLEIRFSSTFNFKFVTGLTR